MVRVGQTEEQLTYTHGPCTAGHLGRRSRDQADLAMDNVHQTWTWTVTLISCVKCDTSAAGLWWFDPNQVDSVALAAVNQTSVGSIHCRPLLPLHLCSPPLSITRKLFSGSFFGERNTQDLSTSFGFILAHLLTLAPVCQSTVEG